MVGSSQAPRAGPRNEMEHEKILRELEEFAKTAASPKAVMEGIAARLHEKMARYNWVGFYLVDKTDPNLLVIGPYVGSFAPNERIPFDTGFCGQAARTGRTVVIDDVAKDAQYLQGSSMVVSEIVVPITVSGKLVGELDVESYFPNTFTKTEQEFVEACARIAGRYLAKGI